MPEAPTGARFALQPDGSLRVTFTFTYEEPKAGTPEAQEKARELLLRLLTPKERDEFTKTDELVIETDAGIFRLKGSGNVYCRRWRKASEWRACVNLENEDGG